MTKLLSKELKLSASILSFFFIAFGFMALIPGYPILLGAFFTCLGIFQSFQSWRDSNDIVYSALLPVSKADVVKSKFSFCIFIEMCSFVIMIVLTLLRMTVLSDSVVYRTNALMNANLVFLGFALLIFALFNLIFIASYFKTAYYFGKPFVVFIIVNFIVVGIAEALHHIPGLENVNSFGFDNIGLQLSFLIAGIAIYLLLTFFAIKISIRRFEKIDL